MNAKKVLLLGGSGFVGTYIANRLSEQGVKVTIPTRRRERTKALIMLPHVSMVEANINDPEQLDALVAGQDAVINLVGILHSRDVALPYSRDFAEAHVELPKKIIAACQKAGVTRLLHMSALHADVNGPSEYLRSKGEGEKAVLAAEGLNVTVFRPSVLFGLGNSFISAFAAMLKRFPLFPLGFGHARFQPVWVADVADAFVAALSSDSTSGKAYDLVGPKVYTLREMVEYAGKLVGSKARILALSEGWAYLQAGLMWLMPKPLLSPDNLRSMEIDSVAGSSPSVFPGWNPTALEAVAPAYAAGDNATKHRLDDCRARAGR